MVTEVDSGSYSVITPYNVGSILWRMFSTSGGGGGGVGGISTMGDSFSTVEVAQYTVGDSFSAVGG